MTAKPKGKPMPTTPNELCARLSELGDSFWIERRMCGSFDELGTPEILDVRGYGPEWVELCRQGDGERYFWARWADLGPFSIVES